MTNVLRALRSIPAVDGLIEQGYITHREAADGLRRSAATGMTIDAAFRQFCKRLPDLDILQFPYVDIVEVSVDPDVATLVPQRLADRLNVFPLRIEDGRLIVAASDPTNVVAADDLRLVTGLEVRFVLAEESAICDAWVPIAKHEETTVALFEEAAPEDDENVVNLDASDDAPIVRAINQIIALAVQQRASDLHIEPKATDVRVRFRLDGVLRDVMRIPRSLHAGVSSRLKIMAEMNIAERRTPQDGRMTVIVEGNPIDLRIATVPTVWGEEVILRILDRTSSLLTLDDLGFDADVINRYQRVARKPNGAVLVVGPTGSGKSTTLYSTLALVDDVGRKVITIEDPVEFRLPDVSQMQVNRRSGVSFATALRSILRSDPDVVMVGEIRDTETARIAVEAAMTGHLVFSTLHTNDAPSALTRLVEMGVEPFLVASAVECVLAQRLVRRLCGRCKKSYKPPRDVVTKYGIQQKDAVFFQAVGCKQCAGTGYHGRLALVELMLVSEEIEKMCVHQVSSDDMRKVAVDQGMRTLLEDGLAKVRQGVTSLEEVLRVVEGQIDAGPALQTADRVVPIATKRPAAKAPRRGARSSAV